jgi:hypothetical protein
MEKNKHHCRVCGLDIESDPWRENGEAPTYEICPCCGVEFGNEDYNLQSVRDYRTKWLGNGAKWFERMEKPDNWDLEEQMKKVPMEFL